MSRTQVTPDQVRNLAYEVRDMRRSQSKGLQVKLLSSNAKAPVKATSKAAGYDLSSAHDDVIPARSRKLIRTDLAMTVPPGTYGRIAPRSGLALKHSIDIGAGVIDEDYTGPIGVLIINHGTQDFPIKPGDRIAQLILERIANEPIVIVSELSNSSRGSQGFGSTGTKQINIIQAGQEDNINDGRRNLDNYGRGGRDDVPTDDRKIHYPLQDQCNIEGILTHRALPSGSPKTSTPPPTPPASVPDRTRPTDPGESASSASSTSVQDPKPGLSVRTRMDGRPPVSGPLESPSAPERIPLRRYVRNPLDTGEDSSDEERDSSSGRESGVGGEPLGPIGTEGSAAGSWQSHSPPKEGDSAPGSSPA